MSSDTLNKIVENLSKNYSENKAVNNINFKIGENEIVGLLGPNGCGKTTTIAMILGLLKPSSGKILIDGILFAALNTENEKALNAYNKSKEKILSESGDVTTATIRLFNDW